MNRLTATGIPMDERIIDEAIAWHVALGAAGDAVPAFDDVDWDAFTCWLESDPQHSIAYEQISTIDAALLANRVELKGELPANDLGVAPVEAPNRRLHWGAILAVVGAACLAAILFLSPGLWSDGATLYQTKVGETRQIALHDGTRIILAPQSSLNVLNGAQDQLELAGVAYFDVPHQPDRVMSIKAGAFAVQDIGTRFEIATTATQTSVTVAEGQVGVHSTGLPRAMTVVAGKRLIGDSGKASVEISAFARQDLASWRGGRLVYQNTPISLVAADLTRYANQRVVVDKSLEGRRFSGVLVIGDGSRLVRNVQHLMGIKAQPDGHTIRLVAGGRR